VTLSVDGKKYKNVGAKFRGNSSFFAVQEGQKRSFNLTLDFVDRDQNLYGYRTLNLLNAHSDPSFLRTVLYNHIAREYTPAPKANFVKVVVNGESWGVYINAQQFNKEFSEEWFDERGGARWKVPAGGGGGRSLNYNGDDPAAYASYELKSKSSKQVRSDLIELCRVLNEIPIDQLDTKLDSVLNVDRVLWFLALDNALIDSDGYYTRGSDYLIYQDQQFGRFHVLPYDSNEVFRLPSAGRGRGGPGGPGGRGGPPGFGGRPGFGRPPGFGGPPGVGEGRQDRPIRPGGEDGGPGDRGTRPQQGEAQRPPRDAGAAPVGFALSPFAGEEREEFPLINRLLANPRIRARYVAHVRTIANRWLDWKLIGPIIEDYRALIDKEIDADTRKLSSYADFAASLEQAQVGSRRPAPGLKTFVEARRDYLINHPDLKRPAPRIHSVNHRVVGEPEASGVTARDSVRVQAMVSDELLANEVLLYFATARNAPFTVRPMTDDGIHLDNRVFHAVIPAQLAGSHIFYYVEARSTAQGTSSFEPESSELHALNYRVAAPVATASAIVINEVLASNSRSARDAQGEFEDWIELYNTSDKAVVLSNMYLSDKDDNPRKWAFPTGTTIAPGGYLIVWADEDGGAKEGLHANFKLSQSGETVRLVDTDDRANAILDSVTFDKQKTDVSMGRYPNGSGSLRPMKPSPNQKNESGTE
jgi:spore coat protein CotH